MWKQFSGRTPVVRRLILDSPDSDKQPQTADQERTMPNMPTTPPPEGPPPGWQPPPQRDGFQQPYNYPPMQQVPQASYTEWWWDGHKWRPPVPRMSRGQALAQLPGALLKLTFLLIFMVIIVVFLWSLL